MGHFLRGGPLRRGPRRPLFAQVLSLVRGPPRPHEAGPRAARHGAHHGPGARVVAEHRSAGHAPGRLAQGFCTSLALVTGLCFAAAAAVLALLKRAARSDHDPATDPEAGAARRSAGAQLERKCRPSRRIPPLGGHPDRRQDRRFERRSGQPRTRDPGRGRSFEKARSELRNLSQTHLWPRIDDCYTPRPPPHGRPGDFLMARETVLTPEGLKQLKKRIDYLSGDRRREVAERIKEAREFGDISENAEYDDAKNEQAMLEARIASLEDKLRSAQVINASELDNNL